MLVPHLGVYSHLPHRRDTRQRGGGEGGLRGAGTLLPSAVLPEDTRRAGGSGIDVEVALAVPSASGTSLTASSTKADPTEALVTSSVVRDLRLGERHGRHLDTLELDELPLSRGVLDLLLSPPALPRHPLVGPVPAPAPAPAPAARLAEVASPCCCGCSCMEVVFLVGTCSRIWAARPKLLCKP